MILLRRYITMLDKLRADDFDTIYDIMKMSFPKDEYRPYDEQKALLNNPDYSIYVLHNEPKDIKAFIAVWEFDEFAFIEHFAVNPRYRNCGIGGYVLSEIVKWIGKNVCLEVEPPETEIAIRRIGFYERNGFFINEYPYVQPPISTGRKAVPLCIMTLGSKVDEDMFEQIKATLYTKVYKYI